MNKTLCQNYIFVNLKYFEDFKILCKVGKSLTQKPQHRIMMTKHTQGCDDGDEKSQLKKKKTRGNQTTSNRNNNFIFILNLVNVASKKNNNKKKVPVLKT